MLAPQDSFDEDALKTFMSKCGVIAEGPDGQPKIKLYRQDDGSLKGDGGDAPPNRAQLCAWPMLSVVY